MTLDDLLQQQTEAQAKLSQWQRVMAEADEIIRQAQIKRRNAEMQIAYHQGHSDRLRIWSDRLLIRGLAEGETNTNANNP